MAETCYNYIFTYLILLAIFAISIIGISIIVQRPPCKKCEVCASPVSQVTFEEEQEIPIKVSDIFSGIFTGENILV